VNKDAPVASAGRPTVAARVVGGRAAGFLVTHLPVPLSLARPFLLRDNTLENRAGGWARLAAPAETARYDAIRAACRAYADDGSILDVGCSRGLLQAGLSYSRYLGIDSHEEPLVHARPRADERTSFLRADADTYVPPHRLDAVVFNEVLYYLPRPVETVERLAQHLAPGGVLVVSMCRAWATGRIVRQLAGLFPVVQARQVAGPSSLTWTVAVLRPRPVAAEA
jgi:2-polyprenyl-3-methyl-5-hydroxy-6-metoxy-1,4-benzoquinol methylase